MMPFFMQDRRQYLVGALLNLMLYIILRIPVELAPSHGLPLFWYLLGPLLPIVFPFVLGALGKKKVAIGALVLASVTLLLNFLPLGR